MHFEWRNGAERYESLSSPLSKLGQFSKCVAGVRIRQDEHIQCDIRLLRWCMPGGIDSRGRGRKEKHMPGPLLISPRHGRVDSYVLSGWNWPEVLLGATRRHFGAKIDAGLCIGVLEGDEINAWCYSLFPSSYCILKHVRRMMLSGHLIVNFD